jgi:hypothetical protein
MAMSRFLQKQDDEGGQDQGEVQPESLALRAPAPTSRMQAILVELDRAAGEYTRRRAERDAANVRFQAARDRFASVKRIANDILGGDEWWHWAVRNRNVMYAGLPVGEAIRDALAFHAIDCAIDCRGDRAAYDPAVTMEQLYQALDEGGFEFTSSAPRREVNAALMRLDGITKLDDGRYEVADAESMLSICFPDTSESKE